jgi:thiol-disulfide isomerase/thioredoxin
MAKKYLLLLLIGFLFACNVQDPLETGKEGTPLPDFKIQVDTAWTYYAHEIQAGNPIVLVYFRTTCPYCRAEIEEILDDIDKLDEYKFYFVSADTLPEIKKFVKQYNLLGYSNVKVGQDVDRFFKTYFKSEGVPYTAIYNKDRKLNAAFFGKIGTREIKKYSGS